MERNEDEFMALLRGGGLLVQLEDGVLVLSDGPLFKTFAVRDLLKACGCSFDPGTKTWRRPATMKQQAVVEGVSVGEVVARIEREVDVLVEQDVARRKAAMAAKHGPTYEHASRAHGARLLSMAPDIGSDGAPNWPEFVWRP
jgi:hypothetical protein